MGLKAGTDYIGVGVGVMVRNAKGEFLLLKRTEKCGNEAEKWCFPGGRVEFGEKTLMLQKERLWKKQALRLGL